MRATPTINLYLARVFTLNFLGILGILLATVYVFSSLELLRQSAKGDHVGIGLILRMGLYRLPDLGETILPFAILFGAMFTFWMLARRHELVVVRGAGFSVWQFLTPILAVATVTGILQFSIINPIGAALLTRYQALEARHFSRHKDIVTLFDQGLWLRQIADDGQSYMIVHADKITLPQWDMKDVIALFFDDHDNLGKRIDAGNASLTAGQWRFNDAVMTEAHKPASARGSFTLPTDLTTHDIEDSFSAAQAQSFWRLPGYIRTLNETGFDATRLQIHFQTLLAQPLLFLAMVLLAAAVSMRPPRSQRSFHLIVIGVLTGFLVFFMSSFLQALGASQQIPVLLASWAPALVSFLLGMGILLGLEDG